MSHLIDQTEVIDQIDVGLILGASHSGTSATVPDGLRPSVGGAFGLLMSTPIEYLSRKSRSDLMRRARAADVALSSGLGRPEDVTHATMLREFLRRMYTFTGAVEQMVSGGSEMSLS